jgi:hypothetical protein
MTLDPRAEQPLPLGQNKTMKRWTVPLLLLSVLTVSSAVAWLVWAQNEYGGSDICPFIGSRQNTPSLVGLGLALAAAALIGFVEQRRSSWSAAIVFALSTFCCAVLAIGVVALFFEGSVHCFD